MKQLKSIRLLRPCYAILFFFMAIIIFTNRAVASPERDWIIQDLPRLPNLDYYLSALEKAVDFCLEHKNYVDINLQLGLFMIDVNLRKILLLDITMVPGDKQSRFKKIFDKNDIVAKYYYDMVQKNRNVTDYWQYQKLALLFYDLKTWQKRPDTFDLDLLYDIKMYRLQELNDIYGTWSNYRNKVNDFEKIKPTPAESDACLALLAMIDPLRKEVSPRPRCVVPNRCRELMQGGNQFGYGLTHRILFMVVARFSRKCRLFSSEIQDDFMVEEYCNKCFNEAKYIASNQFSMPDLMYEQIALCGLFGHAHFLRNSWLKRLLRYQTSKGCFSNKGATRKFNDNQMSEDENDEWKIQRSVNIMKGECDGHFTGMAMAAMANALRYIIENNYMYLNTETYCVLLLLSFL